MIVINDNNNSRTLTETYKIKIQKNINIEESYIDNNNKEIECNYVNYKTTLLYITKTIPEIQSIFSQKITEIENLNFLKNLKKLECPRLKLTNYQSNNTIITLECSDEIENIMFANLENLKITNPKKNINFSKMPKLKRLEIEIDEYHYSYGENTSLSFIAENNIIESLTIKLPNRHYIKHTNKIYLNEINLVGFDEIKKLYLENTDEKIINKMCLSRFTKIEELTIDMKNVFKDYLNGHIKLCSILNKMIKLRELKLIHIYITDIILFEPLNLQNLKYVKLNKCNLSNCKKFGDAKNILSMDLSHNNIYDISWIDNMENLKYLNLEENEIVNFNKMKGTSNVIELNIKKNKIEDINFIDRFINLETLYANFSSDNLYEKLMLSGEKMKNIKNLNYLIKQCNCKYYSDDINDYIINEISKMKKLNNITFEITCSNIYEKTYGINDYHIYNKLIKNVDFAKIIDIIEKNRKK
jgi:hypothetical protein